MAEPPTNVPADRSSKAVANSSTPVVEADATVLSRGGFDATAPLDESEDSDECAMVFTTQQSKGLLTRLMKRVAPARRTMATTPIEETIAKLREAHSEGLIVVRRTGTAISNTPGGQLTAAGADLVVSNVAGRTSIKRSNNRALVRLGTAMPGRCTGETLQWEVRLLTGVSGPHNVTLQLSVFAVTNNSSRPLTEDEMGALYSDALLQTSKTQLFLELADGHADAESSKLTLHLGPSGEFGPAPREFPTTLPGWDQDPQTAFTADPRLLATPRIIQYELEQRGFSVDPITSNYLSAERSDNRISYFFSNSHRSPQTSVRAAADKNIARKIMQRAGVPVAEGQYFAERTQLDEAETLLETLGSIVIKPVDAGHGNGVSVNVTSPEALREAWSLAFDTTPSGVIVERHVAGVEARFMVVDDTCVSVTCARPPQIVGDGHTTIRTLINRLNDVRSHNPLLANRPVLLDEKRMRRMQDHGFSPLTILPDGQSYDIATDTSWYGGTTTEDITDEVDVSHKQFAVEAVRAIPGLAVAGLDIIMSDHKTPATAGSFVVLEVNSQPGLGLPHFPMIGAARNPAGAIIDADLAPRRAETFQSAAVHGVARGARPDTPHPETDQIGRELENLGFELDWLADDYLHAHRDGITTAVWRTYTTLTGKSAASAAQHPRVAHGLLTRAGLPTPRSWRSFVRDADPEKFRNGRQAMDYALTLASPALRVANRDFIPVDPTDEAAFRKLWRSLSRDGLRGIVVAEHSTDFRVHVLVTYGTVLGVRWVTENSAPVAKTRDLDSTYFSSAIRATEAFPGLDIAEVVMHLADPATPATTMNHEVTSIRTSPDLRSFEYTNHVADTNIYQAVTRQHVDSLMSMFASD